MPIQRLLIANRGEIACRIIRSCQKLGIESVLAVSDADLNALPARQADAVIRIGPAPSAQSYLNIGAIVQAAQDVGADAVHPGYGFLSENAALGRSLMAAGIVFIGPSPASLDAVGDKLSARSHALAAGLPVVPGAAVSSAAEALTAAQAIGFPILLKAVSGGGGRGMKRVESAELLAAAMSMAMAEAEAAFGDARVYLESFVAAGRHVEVQILGDGEQAIHLGDRDCSIQRRYQKLLEEAPAPDLDPALRQAMATAAVDFARHLHYRGAGTVEFLVDCQRQSFYFLEMNARIQVEHPVTEMITGLDLVEEQILLAEGRPLRYRQEDIHCHGHAIECRINAEDSSRDFQPSPGTIVQAQFPVGPGIRVDTHVESALVIPPWYDSLLAKIICHGSDRNQAIIRMQTALANLRLSGVQTNTGLQQRLLLAPEVLAGGMQTSFFPAFMQASTDSSADNSGGRHDGH
ncbi:MAG: biotin carboxylase N-terminal domain-containing protein [Pseudomonadales bacterium]|nr:biotin carboxylase N-terminal domain-containing protein [Pseudomonadales bacterium]